MKAFNHPNPFNRPETRDQKFWQVGDRIKAQIDVYVVEKGTDEPSMKDCRHALLPLTNGGYVVYDRFLSQIINGVFYGEEGKNLAMQMVDYYNLDDTAPRNTIPNGEAIGLIYPDPYTEEDRKKFKEYYEGKNHSD